MQANISRSQLFLASRIALIFTAMTFAFRAQLEGVWGTEFSLSKEQVGWVFSPAFWGFTLAMIFGGPLCDVIGMKRRGIPHIVLPNAHGRRGSIRLKPLQARVVMMAM